MAAPRSAAARALAEWVVSRASSSDDVRAASRLVAAYVADEIRTDRAKRAPERAVIAVTEEIRGVFDAMADALNKLR